MRKNGTAVRTFAQKKRHSKQIRNSISHLICSCSPRLGAHALGTPSNRLALSGDTAGMNTQPNGNLNAQSARPYIGWVYSTLAILCSIHNIRSTEENNYNTDLWQDHLYLLYALRTRVDVVLNRRILIYCVSGGRTLEVWGLATSSLLLFTVKEFGRAPGTQAAFSVFFDSI